VGEQREYVFSEIATESYGMPNYAIEPVLKLIYKLPDFLA